MNSLTELNNFSNTGVSYTDQGTGAQTLAARYKINGLLDSAQPVMANIEKICSAAGSWLSYDNHEGKWGVVINNSGTSVASFNDSNILGTISLSGTGLQDLYNSVKVEFPHRDLRDSADFVNIEIPSSDRNANEEDNTLNISYDIINEPIQAQLLGMIELKQSRIDLIISFETDYGYINLKAGDIIDVTDSRFGFSSKLFRIVTIVEKQNNDGALTMEITALEYDANVYSTADLYRYTRTDENGIITIGSIGIPGTPQITKFEKDSRPRILIESLSPTGLVEGMEFWLTTDVTLSEENRTYQLIGVTRPPGGGVYASSTQVEFEFDGLNQQNFLIKSRGFNSSTSGPYSSPSGLVEYVPVQVTDAINEDTQVLDNTGQLLTQLGASLLLNSVSGIFSGNTGTNSLFKSIFDLFTTSTGVDLVSEAQTGAIGGISGDQIWETIDSTTEIYMVDNLDLERFTSITFQTSSATSATVTLNIQWPSTP